VEGGRVTIRGTGFPADLLTVPVGDAEARVSFASASRLVLTIPSDVEGGHTPIRVPGAPGETPYVALGAKWATGLHQVDNPVFDQDGNLFVTYSGARGQEAPVSIFRVTRAGTREPFASGIVNATSMAFGPDGHLYVSSRFEGAVYRISKEDRISRLPAILASRAGLRLTRAG
jgi:streptogramin lyase